MSNPYKSLPDYCYWSRAVSSLNRSKIDPVSNPRFKILKGDKIASAGSCFAQHIARYLREHGYNFLVSERPHPIVPQSLAAEYNYGVYSARYSNIYTARQLLQLFDRAYGFFVPAEGVWQIAERRWVDSFRPTIQPGGFTSVEELEADRSQHLAKVRDMFETLDVFIFTLGLTEAWVSAVDGAVYPVCPGVAGGSFDENKHKFVNLSVSDIIKDFERFLENLERVNSKFKVILTVSPVPLIATASNQHVLSATTYSKSALRVAAEELKNKFATVDYFPSYEIITGNFSRGSYFSDDLRSVTESGVSHVMTSF